MRALDLHQKVTIQRASPAGEEKNATLHLQKRLEHDGLVNRCRSTFSLLDLTHSRARGSRPLRFPMSFVTDLNA